jgi:hypothetical protein
LIQPYFEGTHTSSDLLAGVSDDLDEVLGHFGIVANPVQGEMQMIERPHLAGQPVLLADARHLFEDALDGDVVREESQKEAVGDRLRLCARQEFQLRVHVVTEGRWRNAILWSVGGRRLGRE